MNQIWSPIDDLLLRSLWADGLSSKRIGRKLNRSEHSVRARMHRLGFPSRRSPEYPQNQRIMALIAQGKCISAAARELGISGDVVRSCIRRSAKNV